MKQFASSGQKQEQLIWNTFFKLYQFYNNATISDSQNKEIILDVYTFTSKMYDHGFVAGTISMNGME